MLYPRSSGPFGLSANPFADVLILDQLKLVTHAPLGSAMKEDSMKAVAEAHVVEGHLDQYHPEWLVSGGLRPDVARHYAIHLLCRSAVA